MGQVHSERGQGTTEYVGLLLIVAIIVGAVLVSGGWARTISDKVIEAICQVGGGSGCAAGTTGAVPKAGVTLEETLGGDYVAIGDSYSSGEGAGDYLEGTNDDNSTSQWWHDNAWWPNDPNNNICRRSENAYSASVYEAFNFAGDYHFGACSGAIIDDYENPNHSGNEGEGPQRDWLTEDTSLVTISMGGNDFGFGNVLGGCVTGSCDSAQEAQRVDAQIDREAQRLVELYTKLSEDAPNARILIIGYPQLFPDYDDITNGGDSFISPEEQRWLNERGRHANEAIQRAIDESGANVEFVDVTDALKGHEVGTDDPWINDLDLGIDGGIFKAPVSNESFHPKAEGQEAIAQIIEDYLRNG